MSEEPAHPTSEELAEFARGRLDDHQSEVIERHLADCAACAEALNRAGDADPLVDLIREEAESGRLTLESSHPDQTIAYGSPDAPVKTVEVDLSAVRESWDRYEIVAELGRGGMGVVYRAIDRQLKREVALKVILAGRHSSPQERERMVQEAETIARLKHSGIVQIYEVGEHKGHPYLALELVEGTTLSELIGGEPQPPRWAAAMLLQLARTVHFAHSQSVVHRDLKPSNVLVAEPSEDIEGSGSNHTLWSPGFQDSSGQLPTVVPVAKITDFGLAKQLDADHQLTKTGQAVGTPAYMAPEQASADAIEVGPAADIYALGAILYELLVGTPPFESDDVVSLLMKIINDDPDSPRSLRREVPRDLETICLKCLMKQPSARYTTANDLAADLELYLRGEPIHARPLSMPGKVMRWARHKPVLATVYLTCLCLFGLHLLARFVLKAPLHQGNFSFVIVAFLAVYAGSATLGEHLLSRHRHRLIAGYFHVALTFVMASMILTIDAGPRSGPIPIFLVAIAATALMSPRPAMTWFATGAAALSYTWLVFYSRWIAPSERNFVQAEAIVAYYVCLLLMGVAMHLILRRAVVASGSDTSTSRSRSAR